MGFNYEKHFKDLNKKLNISSKTYHRIRKRYNNRDKILTEKKAYNLVNRNMPFNRYYNHTSNFMITPEFNKVCRQRNCNLDKY